MPRTRELLRSVKNLRILREIAVSEGALKGVGDLIDNFLDSEAMVVSIARFKALPGGAEMMEQRFPAFQPNIETLELLPEGTLGRAYAGMIRRLNYDADFFRPRDTSTEALWLTQRIATTHDIHHVIAGLNTQAQGESAVLAITATQIGFPAYVLLNLLASFKALPGGAEMMDQRFPAFQPNIETLELLQEGTLGRAYAGMIRRLNYDADFFRPRDTSTEALWLTQRIATTHDIHHVIAGLNTQAQGESAVLAITATQIGFPAYVLLNLLASFKAFRFQPTDHEAISRAIAHGQRVGLQAKPLVLQRWEEGWERPLSQWREELGIPMATGETFSATYE